jgi:hypothetical protein
MDAAIRVVGLTYDGNPKCWSLYPEDDMHVLEFVEELKSHKHIPLGYGRLEHVRPVYHAEDLVFNMNNFIKYPGGDGDFQMLDVESYKTWCTRHGRKMPRLQFESDFTMVTAFGQLVRRPVDAKEAWRATLIACGVPHER